MSGLSQEDRERLGDWWDASEVEDWSLATLAPVVEEIVARHVEAFREQAADAIEALPQAEREAVDPEGPRPDPIRVATFEYAMEVAADAVRDQIGRAHV